MMVRFARFFSRKKPPRQQMKMDTNNEPEVPHEIKSAVDAVFTKYQA